MSDYLSQLMKSGKKLLTDTKTPATKEKRQAVAKSAIESTPTESDPHKAFVKRTISEKPKKTEVVEEFKKFIKAEESKL